MQYRPLGKWGAKLSAVGLGSYLTIGFKLDEQQSWATVKTAYDLGINFFDTADAYNMGEGERMIGKCLRNFERHSYFLITKVHSPMGPDPNNRGLSKKHITEGCNASLQRLGLDYVDLFMCHRPDPDTPLEETVLAMEDLIRAGKILYWGVSEWPAEMMVEANAIARQLGVRQIAVNQPRYSLLYRYPERSVFPTCGKQGIGNVIFSGLAHGMLTGKYKPGEAVPEGTRGASNDTNMVLNALYMTEENKVKSQTFAQIAGDLGASPATLALAWCLRRPEVTSTIIGATRSAQIEENVKAADLVIPQDVLKTLDELFPMPQFGW